MNEIYLQQLALTKQLYQVTKKNPISNRKKRNEYKKQLKREYYGDLIKLQATICVVFRMLQRNYYATYNYTFKNIRQVIDSITQNPMSETYDIAERLYAILKETSH